MAAAAPLRRSRFIDLAIGATSRSLREEMRMSPPFGHATGRHAAFGARSPVPVAASAARGTSGTLPTSGRHGRPRERRPHGRVRRRDLQLQRPPVPRLLGARGPTPPAPRRTFGPDLDSVFYWYPATIQPTDRLLKAQETPEAVIASCMS